MCVIVNLAMSCTIPHRVSIFKGYTFANGVNKGVCANYYHKMTVVACAITLYNTRTTSRATCELR